MAGKIYSYHHRIVDYEMSVTGNVKLTTLLNLLMLASEQQSTELGVGAAQVQARGLGWIVTQHDLHVTRWPHYGETITVFTQATEYNKYFCYRDFWIEDEQGTEIARMHTVFVLIDLDKRKIVPVAADLVDIFQADKVRRGERITNPVKVTAPDAGKDYAIRFTDLDLNRHVHNTNYFDWMTDALDREFLLRHEPVRVNIKYEKELHYGDVARSEVQFISDDHLRTAHQIKNGDEVNCVAEIEWRPIAADKGDHE